MNLMTQIKKPVVWVPALATLLAAVIGAGINGVIEEWNSDPTIMVEQEQIMAVLSLDPETRIERLCELHHLNMFQSARIKDTIAAKVAKDPKCTEGGYKVHRPVVDDKDMDEADKKEVNECLDDFDLVTDSCSAYDKSGFHSRPSGSCKIILKADPGRFFAQEHVTVLSESYRRRSGNAAGEAMKPTVSDDGLIRLFTGRIGCTHSRGTGRTCAASATVRAIEYPETCKDIKDILKYAR